MSEKHSDGFRNFGKGQYNIKYEERESGFSYEVSQLQSLKR